MVERNYKVAVIGCGAMGASNFLELRIPFAYSAVGATLKHPRAELVSLVDTDQEKLSAYSQRLKVPGYPDFREMIDRVNPDILWCAAGPVVNEAVIYEGAAAGGVRGIFVEKPLALSVRSLDRLAELELGTTTKIQVNYLRNYDAFHDDILRFVKEGGLGKLQIVRFLYNGGVKAVFPHATAFLMNGLFDKAVSVSGVHSPIENISTKHDPNIDGTIRFGFDCLDKRFYIDEQGVYTPRNVTASFNATGRGKDENNIYLYEIEFTGSEGRLTILHNGWDVRYEKMAPTELFNVGSRMPYDIHSMPVQLRSHMPMREPLVDGLTHLIESIEEDKPTRCNLRFTRDVEEISHALALSAEHNGQTYKLPLEGEDRNHAFKEALAGTDLQKKQAGFTKR